MVFRKQTSITLWQFTNIGVGKPFNVTDIRENIIQIISLSSRLHLHACLCVNENETEKKEDKDDACPPFPLSPNLPKSAVSSSYSQQLAWRCKQVRGVTSRHRAAWLGPQACYVFPSGRPTVDWANVTQCQPRLSGATIVPALCHQPAGSAWQPLSSSITETQKDKERSLQCYSVTPSNTRNLKSSIASITFATSANVRNVLMLDTGGTAADKGGAWEREER